MPSRVERSAWRRWQESPITGEITKETVKTTARGMPGVSGVTVVTTLVCFFHFAHKAAGASSARHSLRPPMMGRKVLQDLGAFPRRGIAKLRSVVIARSDATKQSILSCVRWIASLTLAMTGRFWLFEICIGSKCTTQRVVSGESCGNRICAISLPAPCELGNSIAPAARHARACPGHPRLTFRLSRRGWPGQARP
jgi:hypothetical protein